MKMFIEQQLPVATIVEYSDQEEAVNRYPDQIVSPPVPSPCCSTGMEQVGAQQRDREWPFVYMRCRGCGYTVRRFGSADALSLCSLSDILGPDPWHGEQGEAAGEEDEPVGGSSDWGVGSICWAA